MTACAICPAGLLWMAGFGGILAGIVVAAVGREVNGRRREPD